MPVKFFGVPFVPITKHQVLKQVAEAFALQKNIRIATVNPEYLLEARNNKAFKKSLKEADVRVIDGFGIQLMAWLRGTKLPRVTGADFLSKLLRFAEKNALPLTIYNQHQGLSTEQDIRDMLGKKYPKLKIIYNKELTAYSLVICTYGAPEQEVFLDILGKPGIKIGIGGALDFMTGKQKRAPRMLRKLGIEWFWRLILQPKRIGRIFRAVLVFPTLAILDILKPRK